MFNTLSLGFGFFARFFRSRASLVLENLVLRQQLAVLKRRRPRHTLGIFDKLFWVVVSRFWSGWKQALVVVTPETVARWHRAGFRMYWKWISRVRAQAGRRQTPKEVRRLIFQMVRENPTWGAPRIHGELLMLGFDISERTISRWMKRAPRDPEPMKRWLAFLRNHREAIAAMDFFTVPTITFGVIYCFFVVAHDRRRILHFNVDQTSDKPVGRSAIARSVSVRVVSPIPDLRSRWEVRTRGPCSGSILEDKASPNLVWESVAERGGRALGGELSKGTVGSHHCGK